MANKRFIDFPVATTVGDSDIILIWQGGLNKQTTKATILSGLPEDLADLADVNISTLTNGQILRYDSTTGKWINTDQANLDLDDLNDVSIVSPTNGQVLVYNSSTSKWENSSAGFVPYTGAVTTVDLGAQQLKAGHTTLTTNGSTETLTINHTSGSGKAINVTKGGNGEGLYINKTSGSGNAATIVGTLEATTLVKTGGTSAQFLKANGSVDSTIYVNGSGTTNYIPKFTGATTLGNSQIFDNGTNVAIGTTTASVKFQVQDNDNIFVSHFSGLNQTNGVAFGTSSSNFALIQGYTRTFGATNNITIQLSNNLLIGTTDDNGAKLQVSGTATISSTLSALKGDFGSAFTSTNVLQAIAPSATNSDMFQVGMVGVSNGLTLKRVSSAFIMDWDGSAIFNGTLKTSSPTGSTAQPFKVGSVTTTTDSFFGTVLKMEINGTVYNIMIAEPPL